MPFDTTTPAPAGVIVTPPNRPTISWGSVIAGMITAIAIQLGLAQLCVAVGLAMYTPFDQSEPTGAIAMTTIVAWVICALIGLFIGGWVAGRLAHYTSQTTAALHGVLVWATGAVVAAVVLATSLGLLIGGTASLAGSVAGAAGEGIKAVASGVGAAGGTAASIAAPNWDSIRQQVQEGADKLSSNAQAGAGADMRFADQSRMMDLFGKFFAVDSTQRLNATEKDELAGLVSTQLGISKEAAVKTMDQWQRSWEATVARYESAKEQAKQTAMEAATAAKKYTAAAAGVSFGLMLVGLIAAAIGGITGSMCYRRDEYRSDRIGGTSGRPITA